MPPEEESKKTKPFRSLTVTLIIAFLTLSLAVILTNNGLGLYFNFQGQQKAISDQQYMIAQGAADKVENFIQEKINMMNGASRLGDISDISLENQKTVLDRLLGMEPSFRQVILLNTQNKEILRVSRLSSLESNKLTENVGSDLFSLTSSGKAYISSVYIDNVTSEPMVIIAVPVTDVFGDSIGTLAAEINLKFMWELVSNIKVGDTGFVYVVDKKGKLIAYSDISRVLKGENLINLDEVSEFINSSGIVSERDASISKGIMGTDAVSNFVSLGTPDWAVIVESPVGEAYSSIFFQIKFVIVVTLITFVLTIITGIYLSKRITGPIKELTTNIDDISMGKLDVEISSKLKESNNEIGALARAFDRTTVSLKLAMKQTAPELKKESDSLRKLLEEKNIAEREMIKSQEKLKASEERFSSVANNAGEFILEVDKNGLYTYASPAVKKILGYEPGELMGKKHFYDLFAPDVKEDQKKAVLEGFAKKESFRNFVNLNVRKDGSTAILETSGTPILDNNTNLIGYIGSSMDVSERKRAEDALSEKERNFREIFEDAKVVLVSLDSTGKILDANHLIKDIVGYEPKEVIGKNFAKVGWLELRSVPKTMKLFFDFVRGKDNTKLRELEFKHKNGKKVILELYAEAVKKDGKTDSVLIIGRDVTNRKKMLSDSKNKVV